ncbi:TetR/AcrR family transcriptional regulator [Corynebacterium choanae]|uniref:Transcriptional regulator, TetR family n=1 Tax=Corynebacterium choanae TaxID=1862358 RepID=A0A3G6J7A1_9CORY|nr:TetR/AcrR family transcriptional regulator [Corynebacterium choanae]AZA13991.1 Transcriptional regulator, TetR family [Corynebacterium choanae]
MNIEPPTLPKRSRRAEQIIAVARELTEELGWDNLTMRILADSVGIKAPSLYKHTANKDELRALLTIDSLLNVGYAMWATEHEDGTYRLRDLLLTFRQAAITHPELYRLVMTGSYSCEALQYGEWRQLLNDTSRWLNVPLSKIAPNRETAYSVWAAAYGIATLETNGSLSGPEAMKVWDNLIAIYEPHFAAAARARVENPNFTGDYETVINPLEVSVRPVLDAPRPINPDDNSMIVRNSSPFALPII